MRCNVGPRKIARYRRETGLDIVAADVRGGTHHVIRLWIAGGRFMYWHPDGRLEEELDLRWREVPLSASAE